MQAAPAARPTKAEDDTANALLAASHAVQREMNYTSTLDGPAEKINTSIKMAQQDREHPRGARILSRENTKRLLKRLRAEKTKKRNY